MKKGICLIFLISTLIAPINASASLIGDSVSVDRRYDNFVMSSRTTTVSSAIEIFNWQSLYFDFYDYGVKLIPASSIAYGGSGFNGFDFYDLDFGSENEVIASVSAYFVSILDGSITHLDPTRLSFTDHAFSLDMSWAGFASHPLYIDIETRLTQVSEPPVLISFLLGISLLVVAVAMGKRGSSAKLPLRYRA